MVGRLFGRLCAQLAFLVLLLFHSTHGSWWYMAVASSYQVLPEELIHKPTNDICSSLQFLHPRQRQMCNNDPSLIDVIREGASVGIDECQYQFKNRRWNCTTYNSTNVFGKILDIQTRETAYIYAISSAGIMYSVTRACAKGELVKCGCDKKVRKRKPGADFTWGGCSDNIRYGARFARDFVDSFEKRQLPDGSMNLWNNGAGRKSVKDQMDVNCKCHGVSGDCSVKICWRKMRSFREIGADLKNKFEGASLVRWDSRRQRLKRRTGKQKRPTKKDLVYLKQSPDFCEVDRNSGSLGTEGRECNKTSYGLDGCTLMCCGRGYQTFEKPERRDCDCKFFWCCKVECSTCTDIVEKHVCN